jgi:hypothetical protein
MPISTWLQSAGLIITLAVFAWQIHRARFNQSIDLLFRLENDFFGPAKKLQRVKASRDLLDGKFLEAEPILDFFETMALLLRRRALDKEIVWHTFFYWVDHYYEASRTFIAERQRVDPLVWKDLARFIETLRKYQGRQAGAGRYQVPTAEEIARFLQEEQTEAI